MLAKTHRSFTFAVTAGGLLLAGRFTPLFEGTSSEIALAQAGVVLGVAVVTSILPDFDRVIPFIRHRGITHSVWPILVIAYFTWKYQGNPKTFIPLIGLFLGYTSHIIGDAFSTAGIAWFYPFQRYKSYDSGAFHVTGFRGIFQPIYKVGQKVIIPPTIVWNSLGVILTIMLIIDLF